MLASNLQLQRAKYEERFYNKRRLGVPQGNRGSSPETDFQAGMAEQYAAEQLGCKVNDEILAGGDEGFDFQYRGHKVDVKWMGWIKGSETEPRDAARIIVDLHKLKSDIYLAVSGSAEKGFKILGWCWKKDLLDAPKWRSDHQDEYGRYYRYALHTRELRDISLLSKVEEKKESDKKEEEWWL